MWWCGVFDAWHLLIEVIFLVVILTSIRGYETFNRSSFAAMSMRKYVCGARRSFMRGGDASLGLRVT